MTDYKESNGEVKEGLGTPIDLSTVLFTHKAICQWVSASNEVMFKLIDALQNEGAGDVDFPLLMPTKAEVLQDGKLHLLAQPLKTECYELKFSYNIAKEDWQLTHTNKLVIGTEEKEAT